MQTLKSFLDQALLIWKDSTSAARFGLALLMAICVGSLIGVAIWSATPNFVVLASDIEPDQATKAIDALEAANIDYKFQGSDTILVDQKKRARAQIAIRKLGIGKKRHQSRRTFTMDGSGESAKHHYAQQRASTRTVD